MNVVGYKETVDICAGIYQIPFYMNVVGYKATSGLRVCHSRRVLYERSGI